jgi:hypothetical protein
MTKEAIKTIVCGLDLKQVMTQIPNRPIRMRASEYGIKKLKTILPNLLEWSKEDGESLD